MNDGPNGQTLGFQLHDSHTNFPRVLKELALVATCREPFHQALEGAHALSSDQVAFGDCIMETGELNCETETYEKAHELFGELSRLAIHKYLVVSSICSGILVNG